MANSLAAETSRYLLQHKDNPVDWFAWGEEALELARTRDIPLLVSIGYSACHWCHVMEHESFEDPDIASVMNERFVCIKVDREERPDIDAICMEACQAMTGHGGWPLNAFLTPEKVPFYAGTYFPPESRQGLPSWRQVLLAVAEAWQDRREEIRQQSERVVASLGATARIQPSSEPIREELLSRAVSNLRASYDGINGGWGGAPKFPAASTIELLLARGEREMSLFTLRAMANGGIYDQIGGGFSRYSVDARWTVPHFEKMLYDNALLARAYLHGWQASGEPRLRKVCCETLDWALRELRGPEGGFCSSLDADSEGVEGKYYVWRFDELRDVVGPSDAAPAVDYFGASERGNFEHGLNVLEARGPVPERLAEIKAALFEARSRRVRPGLDDKRLTAWNALMISVLAEAGAVLDRSDYVDAAVACASFLLSKLRDADGRLLRTWKDGRGRLNAYLEDHAFLLEALITLYESTFEPRWYHEAVRLADALIERFSDEERGGFFTTAVDHEALAARRKDLEDTPIPSGNSAAALGLLRLALLSGEGRYERYALGVLRLLFELAVRHPHAFGHLLQAADFYLAPVREVAIVGPDSRPLERVVRSEYRPHLVLAGGPADGVPLLENRAPVNGRAAAYVCEHFVCQAPVTTPEDLAAALG
ncbi:MAG: thioredoxin domain-containing protein [Solirubrobacterales bacterium]|nr:thioredoxin domain-containing protein [Solirubrobacterales bacterium]MBV9916120.1 thioredoxin domain-containing protein [Solirubrobacterales bacterium]